jgi:N-acyl homoserine lactone hydrolase
MPRFRSWLPIVLALAFAFPGCANDPGGEDGTEEADLVGAKAERDIDIPGPIELETVVSARWDSPSAGLVNLFHPKALAAGFFPVSSPIVLAVHVVRHPSRGLFIIDTGVPRRWVAGGKDNIDGLVANTLVSGVKPAESLGEILTRSGQPLAGVFFTHMHFDHVLGLPDVPKGTPLFAGPGELEVHGAQHLVFKEMFEQVTSGHDLRTFDFGRARPLGTIQTALDLFGDGSFYALHVPGHTTGSTAFLARTTKGPVLLTGDCSHTRWGWENGVEPGLFSDDASGNVKSLAALKKLADAHPRIRVVVGHETEGEGAGLRPKR